MAKTWPAVLVPRVITEPELRGMTQSGPRTYGGRDQRIRHDAGFWEYTLAEVVIATKEQALAWRATITAARAGEEVIVRIFDPNRVSIDGANSATLVDDADLRATTINLSGIDADISAGQFFSIGADRLHLVTEVTDSDEQDVGTVLGFHTGETWSDGSDWVDDTLLSREVKIMPPLRDDYDAGTVLSFNNLRLRCVLKDVAGGDMVRDLAFVGTPSVTFVETIS